MSGFYKMDLETFALSPKTGLLSKVRRKTNLNVFLTVEDISLVHWAGNVPIFFFIKLERGSELGFPP